MDHKVHQSDTIAKFIVIPESEFDKMAVKGNAGPSIKGPLGCPPMLTLLPF